MSRKNELSEGNYNVWMVLYFPSVMPKSYSFVFYQMCTSQLVYLPIQHLGMEKSSSSTGSSPTLEAATLMTTATPITGNSSPLETEPTSSMRISTMDTRGLEQISRETVVGISSPWIMEALAAPVSVSFWVWQREMKCICRDLPGGCQCQLWFLLQ